MKYNSIQFEIMNKMDNLASITSYKYLKGESCMKIDQYYKKYERAQKSLSKKQTRSQIEKKILVPEFSSKKSQDLDEKIGKIDIEKSQGDQREMSYSNVT